MSMTPYSVHRYYSTEHLWIRNFCLSVAFIAALLFQSFPVLQTCANSLDQLKPHHLLIVSDFITATSIGLIPLQIMKTLVSKCFWILSRIQTPLDIDRALILIFN